MKYEVWGFCNEIYCKGCKTIKASNKKEALEKSRKYMFGVFKVIRLKSNVSKKKSIKKIK